MMLHLIMRIMSLNSGSNGNVYYFGSDQESILIDAGLSCKEIEKRMIAAGLSMHSVNAVFITHEHSDHIFGLKTIVKKFGIPVYITSKTLEATRLDLPSSLIRNFSSGDIIKVGEFSVTAFPTQHDAADPNGFFISHSGMSAGVFTDIGVACEQVRHYFSRCHAAFLECNYDEQMLTNGPYPKYLQERIRGTKGHLSNREALELFQTHRSSELNWLLLSHLSEHNNDRKLAKKLFEKESSGVKIMIADRKRPGPIIDLLNHKKRSASETGQLRLF